MPWAVFSHANLTKADFKDSVLINADFKNADLTRADFAGSNLTNADLNGACLKGTIFKKAILIAARLGENTLENCDLSGANLSGINWARVRCRKTNFRDADLSGANLRGASLVDCDLSRANLTAADLSGTDLSRADLTETNLEAANLTGAILTDARIQTAEVGGARFWGTVGLNQEQKARIESAGGSLHSPFRIRAMHLWRFIAANQLLKIALGIALIGSLLSFVATSLLYFSNPSHRRDDTVLRWAAESSRKGDFQKANRLYQIVLDRSQDRPETALQVHMAIATDYRARGRFEEAAKHFQIIIDQFPQNPEFLYGAKRELIDLRMRNQGQRAEAIKAYEQLLTESRGDPGQAAEMHDHIARLYRELNQPGEAAKHYQIIIDQFPQNPGSLYAAKRELIDLRLRSQGRRAEAVKAYERLLAESQGDPGNAADLHSLIARLYRELNQPEEAAKHYQIIIDRFPQNPWSLFEAKRGLIDLRLRDQGRRAEAVKAYERLLTESRGDPVGEADLHNQIARLDMELNQPEEAAKHYQIIIDKFPQNRESLYGAKRELIELRLRSQGRRAQAIQAYERLLAESPGDPLRAADLHHHIANLHRELNQPEEAAKHYQIIIDKFPQNPVSLFDAKRSLIDVRLKDQGRGAEAIKAYERLLAESPGDPLRAADLHNHMARLYREFDQPEEAAKHYQIIIDRFPQNPARVFEAKRSLIDVRLRDQGERAQAVKAYERLLAESQGDPGHAADLHNQIARLYRELNQPEEAAKHYQIIIDQSPRNPGSSYAARRELIDLRLSSQGRRAEAIKAYERMLAESQGDPIRAADLHNHIARLYRELNQPEEAAKRYQIIIDKFPQNPGSLFEAKRGLIDLRLRDQGRRAEAVKAYQRLLDQYQNSPNESPDVRRRIRELHAEVREADAQPK